MQLIENYRKGAGDRGSPGTADSFDTIFSDSSTDALWTFLGKSAMFSGITGLSVVY